MSLVDNILAKNDLGYIQKKIAKNLQKKRKSLKFSREDLSKLSGVSYGSLRRFEESGEISLKNLLKIARHFNELELFNDLFQEEKYRSLSQLRKDK